MELSIFLVIIFEYKHGRNLKIWKVLDNSVKIYMELIVKYGNYIWKLILKNGVCYTEIQAARLESLCMHTISIACLA